ncbi:MAG: hypothetical protein M3256_08480 [Actinomycetota bacterium]|nr:hypothetical protein [Actinomycetota bacterium]
MALAAATTVAITVVAIVSPGLVRAVLAALAVALMAVMWLRSPRGGLLVTMAYLPLLALMRRLLIPVDGFTSNDPLLLVVPATTILVLARLYLLERRPLASSLLFKLVLALLVITVAEAFNPEGGTLISGLTALLFLAAPLAWFFIGRELLDRRSVSSVLVMLLLVAASISLYGLYQTAFGFPEWDRRWITINGYAALDVGGATRAFGTFSSAAEYGTYLGMALVVALTLVLKRRFLAALTVPILGLGLFIESGRQPFVLALAAMVAVVGLSTGRAWMALLFVFLAVLGAILLERFGGQALTQSATASANPFISHQVGGLTDPLNPARSTLTGHVQLVLDGLAISLQHPFGLGTALTTIAVGKPNSQIASTEVDFSNAFVSLGWIGGVLFASVVAMSLWQAFRLCLHNRDLASLACAGVLIATLGNWLNGGYYAVAPLVWLVIGWSSRVSDDTLPARSTMSTGRRIRGNFLRWRGSRWFTTTLRSGGAPSGSSSRW